LNEINEDRDGDVTQSLGMAAEDTVNQSLYTCLGKKYSHHIYNTNMQFKLYIVTKIELIA